MKRRKTFNDINITPLTDIFLVLLIIMMVVTPMLDYKGLSLALLKAGEATEAAQKPNTLVVQINLMGEYTVAGTPTRADQLKTVLKERSVESTDGVLIEVDPEASHESVAFAIAAAEQAGITKLALVQKESKAAEIVPPKSSGAAPSRRAGTH